MSYKAPYVVKPPHDQARCEYCAWEMRGSGGVGPPPIHPDCAGHGVLELLQLRARVDELERKVAAMTDGD